MIKFKFYFWHELFYRNVKGLNFPAYFFRIQYRRVARVTSEANFQPKQCRRKVEKRGKKILRENSKSSVKFTSCVAL